MSFKVSVSGGDAVQRLLGKLPTTPVRVQVGILEGATHYDERTGKSILQALIGYALEFGVPENNLEARSYMRKTLEERGDAWVAALISLLKQGVSPEAALEMIGTQMVTDIRAQIDAAESPALKPATLARKKGRGKLLIYTRQLINAIKHEVITGESE
jgi:hypothetical protein